MLIISRKEQLKNDLLVMEAAGEEGSDKWVKTVEEIEELEAFEQGEN